MNPFKAADVLAFAIRIEEDGELFYRKAVFIAEDKEVQDLFSFLAGEEVKHKALFQNMLSKMESIKPAESFPGEYMAYLRDYIDGNVIFTKELKQEELPGLKDTLSAIRFAMGRELDSIAYYHEIKQLVPEKDWAAIDSVIAEERKHFARLAEMKKRY
jgi:rubrerythrin